MQDPASRILDPAIQETHRLRNDHVIGHDHVIGQNYIVIGCQDYEALEAGKYVQHHPVRLASKQKPAFSN